MVKEIVLLGAALAIFAGFLVWIIGLIAAAMKPLTGI
jgi:hypothetical protein